MENKEGSQGDFRYAVGDAKVPWHAVGEFYRPEDALEVIKFMLPLKGDETVYNAALAKIRDGIAELSRESGGRNQVVAWKMGGKGRAAGPGLSERETCRVPDQLDRRDGDRFQTGRVASR